jgi:hypothetical protein
MDTALIASFEWGWDTFVAIGTLGLAAFTAALAWKTSALANATSDDQRAQWRPVLIGTTDPDLRTYTDNNGRDVLIMGVRNVGRGPAFAVQAQLRFGDKSSDGASQPGSTNVLAAGESMELDLVVNDESRRRLADSGRPFPPSYASIEIAYYDVGEWWHFTRMTASRSQADSGLSVRQVFVNQSERKLRAVHGSLRAKAQEARRERRVSRRVVRRLKRAAAK